jgi:uncharacterized BrkB/YihY/UPF0761 family membrane protein
MTKKEQPKNEKSINQLEARVIDKITTLIMSGLGFVTALAWNDAIQTIFREIFGQQEEIWAKFIYATFLTVIVVIVGVQLDKVLKKIKKNREKDSEEKKKE